MLRKPLCVLIGLLAMWSLLNAAHAAHAAPDGSVLPRPPVPFAGQLGPTEAESTLQVSDRLIEAPEGAPNILLIMTDDVGFGAVSTFGGSIPKPNLDRLAGEGLVYNRFHTAGVCSPTRAALLTGRNHHAVGAGLLVEVASPYPGYEGLIPPSAATVARILRDNGYSTAMFGKDHNVPSQHRSPAGPFHHWPTGRGFEFFYGFIGGSTDQFSPALYQGTQAVDGSGRDGDYIFDRDMIDRTIEWLHNQQAAAPDKPFFIYHSFGTAHSPQQVPAEWIEKFHGRFDHGWDEERKRVLERQKAMGIVPENTNLAERPEQIPAWDSLSATEKKVYARMMEVYAAMLAHQDAQLGRLLDELERMGLADNTLVIYIEGDNGAPTETGIYGSLNDPPDIQAPEMGLYYDMNRAADNLDMIGGPKTYLAMPAGWSFGMNAPFPWVKQVVSHLGAVRNGLVISWPKGIARRGELRPQYHHVIDIMPTILEAANVVAPGVVDGVEQMPLHGLSMMYSFDSAELPSRRRTQYYEVFANRGIYHEGWLAGTTPRIMPWDISRAGDGSDVTTYEWELYHLDEDFSQSRNLAAEKPEKLRELQRVFDAEARKYNVYPLQNAGASHRSRPIREKFGPLRTEYVYWGPNIRIPRELSPPIFALPFRVEADIEIPEGGAEGVIYAAGSHFGGWSFHLHEGRPVVSVSHSPLPGGLTRVAASSALPPGAHVLLFEVDHVDAGAELRISVNGEEIARGATDRRPRTIAGGGETYDTGRDTNLAVTADYENEGVFTGRINRVKVTVQPR